MSLSQRSYVEPESPKCGKPLVSVVAKEGRHAGGELGFASDSLHVDLLGAGVCFLSLSRTR